MPSAPTAAPGRRRLTRLDVDIGIMAYAPHSRRRLSAPSRSTARSSSTRRCCRSIAGRPRSTGRSCRGAARPASPSSARMTGSTRALVILQKEVAIGPDDTLGTVYFDRIFPMGVAALLEAPMPSSPAGARAGAGRIQATYEGWVRDAESRIHWANHARRAYDLIRGCNPAPGAWTTLGRARNSISSTHEGRRPRLRHGQRLQARPGDGGEAASFRSAQGGFIEV